MSDLIERTMQVDTDEQMGRHYIPVTLDWEIQTKGKGSSFRIAQRTEDGNRWIIGDSYLHKMIEQMARDVNADSVAKDARIAELEAEIHNWKTWGIIEVAIRNPSVSEYMNHWEGRCLKAEAANAKMKACLEAITEHHWERGKWFGGSEYHTERRDFAREAMK